MRSQRKILIIDDEMSLLKSLVAFFEDEGFTVRGVVSGEDGLEILQNEQDGCSYRRHAIARH